MSRIRKIIVFAGLVAAFAVWGAGAEVIARYEFTGKSPASTAGPVANVTVSDFVISASIGDAAGFSKQGSVFMLAEGTKDTLAGAIAGNTYFSFSVTVADNYRIELDFLKFQHAISTKEGVEYTANLKVLMSNDGFLTSKELGSATTMTGSDDGQSAVEWEKHEANTLITGTTEFRIYGWDNLDSKSKPDWYLFRLDNVQLDGTVSGAGDLPASGDSFAKNKPNVLFIAIDDLNDWVGYLKGHPQAQTPHIDKLAGESLAFTRAYCSAASCGPSRTSLMYGIYPHRSGSYFHSHTYSPEKLIPPERIPLQLAFQKNGYYTSGSGKIYHGGKGYNDTRGWDSFGTSICDHSKSQMTRVFGEQSKRPLSDFRIGISEADPDSGLDSDIVNWGIKQLSIQHKKPFFIAVGLKKPHAPWVAPRKFYDQYDAANIQLPEVPENDMEDIPDAGKYIAHNVYPFFKGNEYEAIRAKEGTWEKLVHAYLATCSYADHNVGRILKALEESPYAKNTIVVLWGDHGWHLGEKEHWRKMTLWEQGTRVPFIIKTPDMKEGKVVNAPVSLQDIYPTLVDLCKLNLSQELDGNSLTPLLNEKEVEWDKPVLINWGPGNFAVRQGQWKLIRYADGSEEFYDIGNDPNEYANVASNPEFQTALEKLRSSVPKTWKYIIDSRTKPFEHTFSKP